ncbi:MAG: glycosyltransferase [Pseudomonadota bacterium]
MDVSIILASYNGASTLPRTLAALGGVRAPAGGMEIILVDNNSSDETAELMQTFARQHGAVVLREPKQGKAHALNAGLEVAQGRLVVFTDDDTIANSDWILAYVQAANQNQGKSVFAGQIRPEWPTTPPEWLRGLTRNGRSCACTPEALDQGPVPAWQAKGPNFMVRGDVARALRFGVDPQNYGEGQRARGNEDTDFVMRAAAASGGTIHYVPSATVRHIIRPHEMTLRAVFERYVRIGVGQPQLQPYTRLGVVGTILRSVGLIAAFAATFQSNRAVDQIVTLAMQIGRLKALMRP